MQQPLLLSLLEQPGLAASLSRDQWQQVLAGSRQHKLQGALAERLCDLPLPLAVRRQLTSARRLVARQQQDLSYELQRLDRLLSGLSPLLLKGAAYYLSGQRCAQGRLCGDIDLLVPQAQLLEAEKRLLLAGWQAQPHSPHDEHYYRAWMHEIPPLHHRQRGTVIDLHHAITPPLGAMAVTEQALSQATLPLAGSGLRVLSPAAMVIHSALHLLGSGEYQAIWRELWDMRQLIQCQPEPQQFIRQILQLAGSWQQRERVESVLWCVGSHFPGAASAWPALRASRLGRLLTLASRQPPGGGAARLALFSYGHLSRLPLPLLVRHLSVKAISQARSLAS